MLFDGNRNNSSYYLGNCKISKLNNGLDISCYCCCFCLDIP